MNLTHHLQEQSPYLRSAGSAAALSLMAKISSHLTNSAGRCGIYYGRQRMLEMVTRFGTLTCLKEKSV
jgi:hypothetical protein